MYKTVIGCWSPACCYIHFSNFSPFPISTMLSLPSVHIHHTINTQMCKGNPFHLVFKDRGSGTDCWEMVCYGSCSGERTCGCFDPSRIPLKFTTEPVSWLLLYCLKNTYHKMQQPHLLWLEGEIPA